MQTLDVFLSRLLPKVPTCSDPLARESLLDAAIEFCEKTQIVKVVSEPQITQAGVCAYDLELPVQQRAVLTTKVWYGTKQLSPAPEDAVNAILAYVEQAGDYHAERGTPRVFYELSPGTIGIYPLPQDTTPLMLSAKVATKPTRSATQLEDILFDDWCDAIVAGAQARIVSIPGQFFSGSPDRAQQAFQYWIGQAKSLSLRGRVQASLSVTQRPAA